MKISDMTPSLLNDTLRAWRQAEEIPAGLLNLDVLRRQGATSRIERGIRLRELVESLVVEQLSEQRRAEGISLDEDGRTRNDLLAALRADFQPQNSELEAWSALYHRFLAPVPIRVEHLAAAVPINVRNFRRRVSNGEQRLLEQLQRLELEEHHRLRHIRLSRHLPPPEYTQLFGVDSLKRELAALLRRQSGPDLVSIEGLGGIGKTALARAVAFELAENSDLEGIAWVSARQTWLSDQGAIEATPDAATSLADIVSRLATQLGFAELAGLGVEDKLDRLATFLRSTRHLIIIDNLESVSDVELLLPALTPLTRPTRFLLTSRQALSHYPSVTRFPVQPLSLQDSRALVESELRRHGRAASLKQEDMVALYEVIGGMPLALKLIAAQMSHWPLSVLLENLRDARHRVPEQLYTFIYRRSWLALDEQARQLLLSLLPLAPNGEDIEWLRLMSFLPPDDFSDALAQLLDYSLLETAGPPESPRYRLHRLTTTFLQTEVLNAWEGADNSFAPVKD
jgi:hypothetical protein